eukprot:13011-Heterococcus_DN1.PRE.1
MAFRVIQGGLSVLVREVQRLANVAAETERLHYLMTTLEAINAERQYSIQDLLAATPQHQQQQQQPHGYYGRSKGDHDALLEQQTLAAAPMLPLYMAVVGRIAYRLCDDTSLCLSVSNLNLRTPDGMALICNNLSFQLKCGDRLLLCGPSGLWTHGSGIIERPAPTDTMFLPQKPYMPLLDLRGQLMYPRESNSTHSNNSSNEDAVLLQALQTVRLGHIAHRCGGLSAVRDWTDELSVGEQQRLSFARLIAHPVPLAFLDEATSALGADDESLLYKAATVNTTATTTSSSNGSSSTNKSIPSSLVSVGHRSGLYRYHTHVLKGSGSGQWQFMTMQDFIDAETATQQQQQH